jgi:Cu(I)/Ag(I) efflux system membrane fusion protein
MMRLLKIFLTLSFVALLLAAGFGYGRWYSTRAATKSVIRKPIYYLDAMHPWYRSDRPGIAPDCGMKLVPVYADGTQGSADDTPSASEQQQSVGVRYENAAFSTAQDSLRAVGRVTADESRITRIQSRTDGWIDTVLADYTGKYIAKGDPLLTFYSPELLGSEQEFLLALKAQQTMQASSMADSAANSHALVEASRRRLELLKMTPGQIDEVERTEKALPSITLFSPASGYIMARNAFPSQRITPETELYTLADLSHVWVIADVFEADASRVHLDQPARISFAGGGSVNAKVSFIQPQADPATHTLKVRFAVPNAGQLKPDMYADIDFESGGARRLMVPAEAVLDAGTSKTMFFDKDEGRFEQRQVETGERIGDRVEIVSGLRPGERYAASGVFLLNSDAQIKAESTPMKAESK